MRSISILVCRCLTSWCHRDNDWRLAPCRALPCLVFCGSEGEWCTQRICGSTWWWRAPKRLFSAGWSHMPHLDWQRDRNQKFFDDRIISKALWPPRSPDLSPPDFFLWSALKGKAYANKPRTIQELENNIRLEIAVIGEDVLQATFANMKHRVQLCLDSGGEHFQHLL